MTAFEQSQMETILSELPRYRAAAEAIKGTLLANLALLGEIPAATFEEKGRIELLLERFKQNALEDVARDGAGNGMAVIPGRQPGPPILILAHADTVFSNEVDHTISIEQDTAMGPAVADNSIALATLPTLPDLIQQLDLRFESDIVLLGAAQGLGRADLHGIRHYLNHTNNTFRAAVCLEGVQLGRMSLASIGMLRGEVHCSVPEEYDWTRFGTGGAIFDLNEVINRLVEIRLPKRPRSSIVLGSIRSGSSFNTAATHGVLRFEIRSESEAMVEEIRLQVDDIVTEVNSATNAELTLNVLARRTPGGLSSSHPLARTARTILRALHVQPRLAPSTSELSALIDRGIPGVTIGLTTGQHVNRPDERIQIEPIFTGLAQLIGIIKAVDQGICDED